jgi:hypothetical protein
MVRDVTIDNKHESLQQPQKFEDVWLLITKCMEVAEQPHKT